ncbi:diguanylate cyclase [Catellatospora sp. TT07R-123]|uniref:bifunctional diguanylate cyclase/phosphohydrolase n=1 Tax=Catellatospora sp. TT07R-123 TaxID=2733863 RepID=UPI001BB40EFE|nr:diguanylate cyclase [Catellatospora sp. TT07R-123]
MVGFALGALGWLILYGALTYLTRDSPDLAKFVGEIVYLVPMVTLVGLSVYAARRTTGRIRTAWRLLVVANVLWTIGDTIWAVYVYISPTGPPVPSAADACYILRYLLTLLAIVIGLGLRIRGMLDALLVAAAAAAIGWQVIIAPLVPENWNPAAFVTFLYPVFSVIIASVLAALLLTGSRRVPASMVVVGTAFGFASVFDAVYAYSSVLGAYTSSTWLNVGWQAEVLLLCVAALMAARRRDGDERLLQQAQEVSFLPALVAVVIVGGLVVADMILVGQISRVTLSVAMLLLMGLLLRQIAAARDRSRLTDQLRTAAITDALTGLYNRRFFEEMLAGEIAAGRRHAPLSLILIDLDHFKTVNDTHGHPVGDAVLTAVADRLRRPIRGSELLCRYGGEEFVCLLPRTDGHAAVELAEQMRADLRSTPLAVSGAAEPLPLTASFGVACADPADGDGQLPPDGLVDAADRALYRAKALGRDQVILCGRSGQVEAAPALDLPAGLVWLADEADRIRGDDSLGAAVSGWAWQTAARLGLDEAAQLRTAAAARLYGIGCLNLGCGRPRPDGADPARPDGTPPQPEGAAHLVAELSHRPDLAPLIAAHHEHHDGSGYPCGLAGRDIPIGARIIAVCHAWADARGPALSTGEARLMLATGRGTRFDPAVLDAFLSLVDEGAITGPEPRRRSAGQTRLGTAPG